ncbi:ATP-binding protein [Massilibacteroides sp.]|uniref:ATP-binding protein n=1 Tax=Massilibacteroides sp. TaxID=2034766 RepID=UPI00261FCFF1|nr:ATP-binding protein [Massilibacteroides sp.]MDD4516431.1 ATP-binding protein [Massilibacteroides sp.]
MEVKRDIYLKKLIASKQNGMIKIVTGMRRCGKSYLLFNLFCNYLKETGVDDSHIIQVDLEDRRNKSLRDPDALLEYIDGRMTDDEMYYILLDEVQHVKEFEDVLNSYLKIKNADVYVTGSNSKFLSKDVITEFRGRGDEIKVAPLCFCEFMSVYKGSREQGLEEYMTYGGLPGVVAIADETKKMEYLNSLFEKVYLTDIKDRYKIKNDSDLAELIDVVASSVGGLINPTKIENTFASVKHSKISYNTIKSYLDILQDVFLIEKSIRYDIKGRKYIDTPAKYYFSDIGLRNARINFRQYEVTHLMENLIYNELRVRGLAVDVGVVVINTKDENGVSQRKQLEVDFVCNQGSKRYYIQSALRLPTEEKREQELRSLKKIDDSFLKFVITEDPIKRYHDDNGIVFMNIYEFLIDRDSLRV